MLPLLRDVILSKQITGTNQRYDFFPWLVNKNRVFGEIFSTAPRPRFCAFGAGRSRGKEHLWFLPPAIHFGRTSKGI